MKRLYNKKYERINKFIELGYTKNQVIKMTVAAPAIFSYNISSIEKRIDDSLYEVDWYAKQIRYTYKDKEGNTCEAIFDPTIWSTIYGGYYKERLYRFSFSEYTKQINCITEDKFELTNEKHQKAVCVNGEILIEYGRYKDFDYEVDFDSETGLSHVNIIGLKIPRTVRWKNIVQQSEKGYVVKDGDDYAFYDNNGELVLDFEYQEIKLFDDHLEAIKKMYGFLVILFDISTYCQYKKSSLETEKAL